MTGAGAAGLSAASWANAPAAGTEKDAGAAGAGFASTAAVVLEGAGAAGAPPPLALRLRSDSSSCSGSDGPFATAGLVPLLLPLLAALASLGVKVAGPAAAACCAGGGAVPLTARPEPVASFPLRCRIM